MPMADEEADQMDAEVQSSHTCGRSSPRDRRDASPWKGTCQATWLAKVETDEIALEERVAGWLQFVGTPLRSERRR